MYTVDGSNLRFARHPPGSLHKALSPTEIEFSRMDTQRSRPASALEYNLVPMAVVAGTRFGPYEIEGLIGAGGMGEVYRARDTRLQRAVAIKILPAHLSSNLPPLRELLKLPQPPAYGFPEVEPGNRVPMRDFGKAVDLHGS